MFAATRHFITARQKYAKYVVEQKSVKVIGGAELGTCFESAYANIDRSKGIRIVSGWIIDSFNPDKKSTEIISHFWNVDGDGNMFDTMPLTNQKCEHVIDMDLIDFGQMHFNQLSSLVPSSLLLSNGQFQLVERYNSNEITLRPTTELSNATLFHACKN
jgi:hypothetical protein